MPALAPIALVQVISPCVPLIDTHGPLVQIAGGVKNVVNGCWLDLLADPAVLSTYAE